MLDQNIVPDRNASIVHLLASGRPALLRLADGKLSTHKGKYVNGADLYQARAVLLKYIGMTFCFRL